MTVQNNEKILSEFSIDNSGMSLFHQVKTFGRLLNGERAKHHQKCEIFLGDSKIIFRMKGSEFTINCSSSKNIKIELYYTDLKEALKNDRSAELKVIVQERNFIINARKLLCTATVYGTNEMDFMLESGLSALNFGEVDPQASSWQKNIFKLKSTGEEIHLNTLQKDAEMAALLLRKYKVDSNKIMHLIIDSVF